MTHCSYRVMILDMTLAGYRPDETIEAVRTSPGGATMPIVAVIDDPTEEELDALAAMNIVDWIPRSSTAKAVVEAATATAAVARGTNALPLILDGAAVAMNQHAQASAKRSAHP